MNENDLIAQLTASWQTDEAVLTGVGDDCAVLRSGEKYRYLLFKTDAVVENRHFTPETAPALVGRKAVARVLSDFAAMGGRPMHALVTLGLPAEFPLTRLRAIYRGLTKMAEANHLTLVGGETTRTVELILSISALGETRGYAPVLRSGAHAGDHLFVTGKLGGSLRGKHLRFTPRLDEGQFLARGGLATSMMDLSDGLGTDLPRLARASGLAFILERTQLPRTRGVSWEQACSEGEDYELLFTVAPGNLPQLRQRWPFATPLTRIGQMIPPCAHPQDQASIPDGFDHLQNA